MYCQNCQKEVNNNSSYCPYCGQKLKIINYLKYL